MIHFFLFLGEQYNAKKISRNHKIIETGKKIFLKNYNDKVSLDLNLIMCIWTVTFMVSY